MSRRSTYKQSLTIYLFHGICTVNDYAKSSPGLAGLVYVLSLAICRPSGSTVATSVVGIVVVGVCKCSQMRTSKCTCLIFGVSIGLDPG